MQVYSVTLKVVPANAMKIFVQSISRRLAHSSTRHCSAQRRQWCGAAELEVPVVDAGAAAQVALPRQPPAPPPRPPRLPPVPSPCCWLSFAYRGPPRRDRFPPPTGHHGPPCRLCHPRRRRRPPWRRVVGVCRCHPRRSAGADGRRGARGCSGTVGAAADHEGDH